MNARSTVVAAAIGLAALGVYFWADARHAPASTTADTAIVAVVPPVPRSLPDPNALATPSGQNAGAKMLVEGHWRGMELIELTSQLAAQYGLDATRGGLLVDEVTLEALASGIRAGDVIQSIASQRVRTLGDLRDATFRVREQRSAPITLLRNGRALVVLLETAQPLGFAMFESAPPIPPTAVAPHGDRGGPCTDCHVIMSTGGQLAIDAGDLTGAPPPVHLTDRPRHRDRGPCAVCHPILPAGR